MNGIQRNIDINKNIIRQMDKQKNKYITVEYKLYTVDDEGTELVEQTTAGRPFQFISGFGITLKEFENRIAGLEKGEEFDFTLNKDQAYGDYEPARVISLDRETFSINGHFDHEHIYKDAIVPLQNEDGNHFYGRVLEVGLEKVLMDLNNPLAGKALNFKGRVTESREATNDEIKAMINRLSGEECECGCGCEDCGEGHCGGEGHKDDGCCGGHGHRHGEGGCCHGHHHG